MAQAGSQTRNFQFWNSIAATPATFNLDAGVFGLTLSASVWGSATLQRLLYDPSTGALIGTITVATAVTANGYATVQLPAGIYQLTLSGVTALIGAIEKIASGSG